MKDNCKNSFVLLTWFPGPSQPVQIQQLAIDVRQKLSLHGSYCPVPTEKPCQSSQAHHADSQFCQVSGWHWICGCGVFLAPLHLRKKLFWIAQLLKWTLPLTSPIFTKTEIGPKPAATYDVQKGKQTSEIITHPHFEVLCLISHHNQKYSVASNFKSRLENLNTLAVCIK